MLDFIKSNVWLILFILWGLPLTYYRSKFRKIVYQTNDWKINIKPIFLKELKALFGSLYPYNNSYLKLRNFYRFYLSVYLLLFIGYYAWGQQNNQIKQTTMSKVEVGSSVPLFSLQNQHDQTVHINELLGKKNLVIYFYPKDDSPGCTKQACTFQDQYELFKKADAEIIGISAQSVKSHKEFASKYRLNFLLLSDPKNRVRNLFGVPTNLWGLLPGRVTYVIDKKGIVIYTFNSQSQASRHVDEALRILMTNQTLD